MRSKFTIPKQATRKSVSAAATVAVAGIGILGFSVPASAAGSFTAGDLAVYEVTQSSGAGGVSAAGAVSLVDYSTGGVASGYSVSMPTADSGSGPGSMHQLVESGKATNDGDLTLSEDGQYLYATGYDAAVGTASITSAGSTGRTVAIVGASGAPDTSTSFTDSTTEAQNFRSAAGTSGGSSDFYNGGGAGIGYTADGTSTNSFIDAGDATHQVQIANGNLYESTASEIDQLGTGLPVTAVAPTAVIPSTILPHGFDPNGFAFANLGSSNAPDTLYVADTANNVVEKYAYDSVTGLATALEGTVSVDDPTGLVVSVSGGTARIYITNGVGTNTWATQISELTDSSGSGASLPSATTVNALVTAGSSSTFHGLAWAPQSSNVGNGLPEASSVIAFPILGVLLFGGYSVYRRRSRATA